MGTLEQILDSTCDFYEVSKDDRGKTIVTPLGYIYCAGSSVTDDPEQIYRWNEYSSVDFTLQELWECNYDPDENVDFQCRRGDSITDLTRAQACEKLLELMCGMGSERHCVPYDCIEEGLETGLYYNGAGLIW